MASQDAYFHIFQWHFLEINHSNFHSYSHGIFLLIFFFALLILIAALFLLAHFCRRRRLLVASPGPAETTRPPAKIDIEALENKSSVGVSSVECCICLNVFKEEEKVKVLPECEHVYHSQCVETWLSANPTCPLCRASLRRFMDNI